MYNSNGKNRMSLKTNSKQNLNSFSIFLKIFLRRIYMLPYLPLIAYELFKFIETSRFNLWGVVIVYSLISTFLYIILFFILYYLEKKLFRTVFEKNEVKCAMCDKRVKPNFKIFQKTFHILLCDYHIDLYRKSPTTHLKAEKKNFYKFNNFLFGISFLVLLTGVIILIIAGFVTGRVYGNTSIGKLQVLIILFTLFPIQLLTHIFFSLKITKAIKKSFG